MFSLAKCKSEKIHSFLTFLVISPRLEAVILALPVSLLRLKCIETHRKKKGQKYSWAVFTPETGYPFETDNPSSKSAKTDGKTDV